MATLNDSWYRTLDFPLVTAKAVQAQLDKKYITKLTPSDKGLHCVLYRGLTDSEKLQRKQQAASSRKK